MNKFRKIDKKNELENTYGCSLNEQDNDNIDICESNNGEIGVVSDEDNVNNFSVGCFSERSLSKLKIIKTYLRWTMFQEKLNELVILSIKNEMLNEINFDNLINNFA